MRNDRGALPRCGPTFERVAFISKLVERGWSELGAGAAAERVAAFYGRAGGNKAWRAQRIVPLYPLYEVSRGDSDVPVYVSPSEARARDVSEVLNELTL